MRLYNEINADDLFKLMTGQSLLLVDVRSAQEVAGGVINGAIHIPLAMLPAQYEPFTKVGNVVFYCQHGIRSAHAAAFVASKDCKNVYTLVGGISAWDKAGYTLTPLKMGESKHAI